MNGGEEGGAGERESSRAVATRTTAAGATGFLVVDQQLEGLFFTEGAFPYVRLEAEGGGVVMERLFRDTRSTLPLIRQRLAPGNYRLTSHQRPCDGACPSRGLRGLDPPRVGCTATFHIGPGQTLTATVGLRHRARACDFVFGERVSGSPAHQRGFSACRRAAGDRHHSLRFWAKNWEAESTRSEDVGAAYAEITFRGFEPWIREAAVTGCVEGIGTMRHPIRLRLDDAYTAGETIDVTVENVGTRAYMFQPFYQACFFSYFDSSGRRFKIPPGTHCDLLGKETIRPGERKKLFRWSLDECVRDAWGCVESRPLPAGTYTIRGTFKARGGGPPARVEETFRISRPRAHSRSTVGFGSE
jgi:hypothetical protein